MPGHNVLLKSFFEMWSSETAMCFEMNRLMPAQSAAKRRHLSDLPFSKIPNQDLRPIRVSLGLGKQITNGASSGAIRSQLHTKALLPSHPTGGQVRSFATIEFMGGLLSRPSVDLPRQQTCLLQLQKCRPIQ